MTPSASIVHRASRLIWPSLVLLIGLSMPLYAQELRFADGLTYNDFFAVTVVDGSGAEYTLFDVASFDGENPPWPDNKGGFGPFPGAGPPDEMKYFFWVRRLGDTGAISYPLSFRKIREIRFTGPGGRALTDRLEQATLVVGDEERPVQVRLGGNRISGWFGNREPVVPSYTPAILTLTDGAEQKVYLKTDGFLGGIDEEFGTYGLLWLMHDDIDRIIFNHTGRYQRCPECGAIFYDDRENVCPFDGTELNRSVEQ